MLSNVAITGVVVKTYKVFFKRKIFGMVEKTL
jgi:hypothetical protein